MANSLSEGFIRLTYSGPSGIHHAMYPVNYSGTPTPGVEPTLVQKDTTTVGAIAGFADFIAAFGILFNDDTLFGLAEAYTVDPDTEERQYIFGWDVNDNGSNASANVPLGMTTLTYKTTTGGVLKIVAMEPVFAVNQKIFPPYLVDSAQDVLTQYITGDNSIIVGRDDEYAFAPISLTSKTSDALRERVGL